MGSAIDASVAQRRILNECVDEEQAVQADENGTHPPAEPKLGENKGGVDDHDDSPQNKPKLGMGAHHKSPAGPRSLEGNEYPYSYRDTPALHAQRIAPSSSIWCTHCDVIYLSDGIKVHDCHGPLHHCDHTVCTCTMYSTQTYI